MAKAGTRPHTVWSPGQPYSSEMPQTLTLPAQHEHAKAGKQEDHLMQHGGPGKAKAKVFEKHTVQEPS